MTSNDKNKSVEVLRYWRDAISDIPNGEAGDIAAFNDAIAAIEAMRSMYGDAWRAMLAHRPIYDRAYAEGMDALDSDAARISGSE